MYFIALIFNRGLAARGHFGSCGCVHRIANISLILATNCTFELQRYWNTKLHQYDGESGESFHQKKFFQLHVTYAVILL